MPLGGRAGALAGGAAHPRTDRNRTQTGTESGTWSYRDQFGSGLFAGVDGPHGVVDSGGGKTVRVADYRDTRISVWTRPNNTSRNWSYDAEFGTNGYGHSNFALQMGVVVSADTLTTWVADASNNRISVWTRPDRSALMPARDFRRMQHAQDGIPAEPLADSLALAGPVDGKPANHHHHHRDRVGRGEPHRPWRGVAVDRAGGEAGAPDDALAGADDMRPRRPGCFVPERPPFEPVIHCRLAAVERRQAMRGGQRNRGCAATSPQAAGRLPRRWR